MRCDSQGLTLIGAWQDIRFTVSLVLAKSAPAWFWHVALENTGDAAATLDLIYAQDLALAHYGAVRLNEYYVSQYLDHTPLAHPERGWVLASRQNQSMGGRNPWCLIGSLGQGVSYATDALQVHGLGTRAAAPWPYPGWVRRCLEQGREAEGLPGLRRQHEHGMAAIQDAPVQLPPGGRAARGFFGWFEADHPEATSTADLAWVERVLALPEAVPVQAADTGERRERRREPVQHGAAAGGPGSDGGRDRRPLRDAPAGGGTGGRPPPVVLRGGALPCGAQGQGAEGPAPSRADPAHRRRTDPGRGGPDLHLPGWRVSSIRW